MLQEVVYQIKKTVREELAELHTAMPATIVSVNPENGLATVLPLIKRTLENGRIIDYPQISGVPIVMPQGANQNVSISFPVKAGDSCLLIISEQSLEYWLYNRETDTTLLFDITNAICIPGMFRKPTDSFWDACENNSVIIDAGSTSVCVGSSGVSITGDLTINGNLSVTGTINGTEEES